MVRAAALILAAGALAGCDALPTTWSEDRLREIAREEAANSVNINAYTDSRRASRIRDLEARVEKLERERGDLEAQVSSLRNEMLIR